MMTSRFEDGKNIDISLFAMGLPLAQVRRIDLDAVWLVQVALVDMAAVPLVQVALIKEDTLQRIIFAPKPW